MAATMTFSVRFVWNGNKPNIFKRKMLESEYAQVNNWLQKRTGGQKVAVSELEKFVDAYQIVYPNLQMRYEINMTGELVGNYGDSVLTYELGPSI